MVTPGKWSLLRVWLIYAYIVFRLPTLVLLCTSKPHENFYLSLNIIGLNTNASTLVLSNEKLVENYVNCTHKTLGKISVPVASSTLFKQTTPEVQLAAANMTTMMQMFGAGVGLQMGARGVTKRSQAVWGIWSQEGRKTRRWQRGSPRPVIVNSPSK